MDFSQSNLRRSDQERESSARLRGLVDRALSQSSQDMRDQADRVEEALSRRVAETEDAAKHLEIELKEVKRHALFLQLTEELSNEPRCLRPKALESPCPPMCG